MTPQARPDVEGLLSGVRRMPMPTVTVPPYSAAQIASLAEYTLAQEQEVARLREREREWPHSHGDDPRLANGDVLQPTELETVGLEDTFVRCYDCRGAGCDSCGGTGFDWSDTADLRATIAALAHHDEGAA